MAILHSWSFLSAPRENPWFEFIETEKSAHPFHDWNERALWSAIGQMLMPGPLMGKGKILEILIITLPSVQLLVPPFSLAGKSIFPSVYQRILEGDRES